MDEILFEENDFDQENLKGQATIHLKGSSRNNNELEAIREACKNESKKLPEGYLMSYDKESFYSKKTECESGEKSIEIHFGFEIGTNESTK